MLSKMDHLGTVLGHSTQLLTANHHAVTSLVASQQLQLPSQTASAANQVLLNSASATSMANNDDDVEETIVSNAIRRTRRAESKRRSKLRLGLPYWIYSRTFEIVTEQAFQGWDFKIRTYRTVPGDSAIFRACQYTDLPLVRQLLASGKASPFDRTPEGWTPLHVCILPSVHDLVS